MDVTNSTSSGYNMSRYKGQPEPPEPLSTNPNLHASRTNVGTLSPHSRGQPVTNRVSEAAAVDNRITLKDMTDSTVEDVAGEAFFVTNTTSVTALPNSESFQWDTNSNLRGRYLITKRRNCSIDVQVEVYLLNVALGKKINSTMLGSTDEVVDGLTTSRIKVTPFIWSVDFGYPAHVVMVVVLYNSHSSENGFRMVASLSGKACLPQSFAVYGKGTYRVKCEQVASDVALNVSGSGFSLDICEMQVLAFGRAFEEPLQSTPAMTLIGDSTTTSSPIFDTSYVPTTDVSPDISDVPTTDVSPDTSDVPTTDVRPDTSDVPTTDVSPDTSDVPTTDVSPDTSDVPTTDVSPDTSDVPTTDVIPHNSDVPTTNVSPDTSDVPTTDVSPDTSDIPTTDVRPGISDVSLGTSDVPSTDVSRSTSDVSTTDVSPSTYDVPTYGVSGSNVKATPIGIETTTAYSSDVPINGAKIIKATSRRCSRPPRAGRHMVVHRGGVYVGCSVTYVCDTNYEFAEGGSQRTVVCRDDGTWSDAVGDCQLMTCPSVPTVLNASVNSTDVQLGTAVLYTCKGDTLFPNGINWAEIRCIGRGSWYPHVGSCKERRCSALPYVDNTRVSGPYTSDINSRATFVCLPGHRFKNGLTKKSIACRLDQTWEDIEECTVTRCSRVKSPENGYLIGEMFVEYNSIVKVQCKTGYRTKTKATAYCENTEIVTEWRMPRRRRRIVSHFKRI
ncbi:hypothetical protein LSAT2_031810 [Lamellibrachia satsuma]|nr:hypothetical protein LSAT2_031810 [Lamellibrachia satsuma]